MKLRIMVAALVAAAASIAAFGATTAQAAQRPPSIVVCNSQLGTVGPYASNTDGYAFYYPWLFLSPVRGYWVQQSAGVVKDPWKNYGHLYFGSNPPNLPGVVWTFVTLTLGACPTAAPPQPANIFLCYSADQTQPGVWPQDVAEQLLKQGYWLPYAVSGDSSGGTNLGGYHLTCNIASTQSVSDSFVGGDGTLLGPAYAGDTVGLYPQVGG